MAGARAKSDTAMCSLANKQFKGCGKQEVGKSYKTFRCATAASVIRFCKEARDKLAPRDSKQNTGLLRHKSANLNLQIGVVKELLKNSYRRRIQSAHTDLRHFRRDRSAARWRARASSSKTEPETKCENTVRTYLCAQNIHINQIVRFYVFIFNIIVYR